MKNKIKPAKKNFSARSLLMQASALKAEGKYKESIDLLELALASCPNDPSLTALLQRVNLLYKVRS